MKQCPACRHLQETGEYCAQCGTSLKVRARPNMEARLLFPSTLLILLGWLVIALGLYASYRTYIEVRTWGGSLEGGVPSSMPVVSETGISEAGTRTASLVASVIGVLSVSMGGILIGVGNVLSLLGALSDKIDRSQK